MYYVISQLFQYHYCTRGVNLFLIKQLYTLPVLPLKLVPP